MQVSPPIDAGAGDELSGLLDTLSLSSYLPKLVELGADFLGDLKGMSEDELMSDAGMKKLHARRCVQYSFLLALAVPVRSMHMSFPR